MGFHHRGSIRPVPASFSAGAGCHGAAAADKERTGSAPVRRIMADIDADRREWEFSALSPEDQQAERARAEQSQKEWKRKIAELKRKRGIIEAGEDMEEG